jgi:choline dehydrogenase-like flavoprotein
MAIAEKDIVIPGGTLNSAAPQLPKGLHSLIISDKTLSNGATLVADLAVVGAGPAGIVTALEVARRGFDVLLLESGEQRFNSAAQELAEAAQWDPDYHSPMSLTVRRQVGGSSVIWAGRCVPFDRVDFDRRPFVGDSGWPVSYDHLRSYFERACDWLACGRPVFDVGEMCHLPPSLVPGLVEGEVRTSSLERWSLPTNFGREYGPILRQSGRVRVVTGLTCTQVVCGRGRERVDHLACATLDGKHVQVRCRAYVIAAGGLDSTRLLLASRGPDGGQLGNHSAHLGSWYMSHTEGVIANARFTTDPRATIFGFERDIDGTYVRRRLSVSREAQHRLQLPNVVGWLANPELADPRHRDGTLSFLYLVLRSPAGRLVAPTAQRLALTGETVPGSPYGGAERGPLVAHLQNLARDAASVARFAPSFGAKRFLARRHRVPGYFAYSPDNLYPLQYHGEQSPSRRSRVTLSDDRDALGMPRLRIDLRFCDDDIDGIIRSHQLWDQFLRRNNLGRLEYLSANPEATVWDRAGGGFHQVGTTRMAARPEDGVVSEHLGVYGVSNLFVASSSVFVTSGQANPTFMVVVLAVRLADHLAAMLRHLSNEAVA